MPRTFLVKRIGQESDIKQQEELSSENSQKEARQSISDVNITDTIKNGKRELVIFTLH